MENNQLFNSIIIFGLENGQYNINDIKKVYRKLASSNHPDKGGNNEIMQLINNAYEDLTKYFEQNNLLNVIKDDANQADFKSFNFEFIKEVKTMQGVIIEVCGCWVWLSGDTFTHKAKIQALKFKFSGAKKRWYWSPTIDDKFYRRGSKSMQQIRNKYGSVIIESNQVKNITL